MSEPTPTITASGGVVVRNGTEGPEYLAVHRPRYDDWSLPKGKDEPGETDEETAVREILEETGVMCQIHTDLGTTDYPVKEGHKRVHWFGTRPIAGGRPFLPNSEVDQIRWLSENEAVKLLSYDHDRRVLTRSSPALLRHGTFYVIRHGHAGDRTRWQGDDLARPLSSQGEYQADALANLLEFAHVERIVSSPAVRCVQTVAPLAERVGLQMTTDPRLGEEATIEETRELVNELGALNTVLCTHGDLMPRLVPGDDPGDKSAWPKGATWAVTISDGHLTTSRKLETAAV